MGDTDTCTSTGEAAHALAPGGVTGELPTPNHFPAFPYEPYNIQQGFMQSMYRTIEAGGLGLLESPTGTGKTISMICSTLQWLVEHRERERLKSAAHKAQTAQDELAALGDDVPDWLRDAPCPGGGESKQLETSRVELARQRIKSKHGRAINLMSDSTKHVVGTKSGGGDKVPQATATTSEVDELEQYVIKDGAGQRAGVGSKWRPPESGFGSSSSEDEDESSTKPGQDAVPEPYKTQVIFCSRTHSQLSQFVGELKKTAYAESIAMVALASRKVLCINESVRSLGSQAMVNERCMDLQQNKSKTSKQDQSNKALKATDASVVLGPRGGPRAAASKRAPGGGCPHLKQKGKECDEFGDQLLTKPLDVEDLHQLGGSSGVCPYYGARRQLHDADLLLLPYSAVLQKEARESLGISLAGNVVVFDEAHNLVDAISNIHSCSLSEAQLLGARRQLLSYLERFKSLLSPSSAQQIQLLIRVVAGLSKVLTQPNQATENISDLPGVHQAPNHGPQARHHNTEPDSRTSQPSQTAEEQASRQHQNGEPNSRTSQPSQQQQQASRQHQNGEPNSRTSQPRQAAGEVASCRQQQQNRPARPQNKADKADSKSLAAPARVLSANDFLFDSGLDNVNLWGLLRWVKDSKVLLKVSSYAQSVEVTTTSSSSRDSSVNLTGVLDQRVDRLSALHAVTAFMGALTNADSDGRVIVSVPPRSSVRSQKGALPNEEVPSLKYILLDAAVHFAKVLSGARSVVLASGTLSPVQGLIQQLFPAMSLERDGGRLMPYSCGHVVPSSNLMLLVAGKGPTGLPLELNHRNRSTAEVMDELGRLLYNICNVVPDGVVVFVPSFSYMDQLALHWSATGALAQIEKRKKVFLEPRSSSDVERVLQRYAQCIGRTEEGSSAASKANGALLISVVGGKLSEGINFGDEMGRCVVVIGMPYPNPSDPELKERMAYLDAARAANLAAGAEGLSGQQYYSDLCMKAVNQCVGRVIRHRGDYAAVVLADSRYLRPSSAAPAPRAPGSSAMANRDMNTGAKRGGIMFEGGKPSGGLRPVDKLPGWVLTSLESDTKSDFGFVYGRLHAFFKKQKQQQASV